MQLVNIIHQPGLEPVDDIVHPALINVVWHHVYNVKVHQYKITIRNGAWALCN